MNPEIRLTPSTASRIKQLLTTSPLYNQDANQPSGIPRWEVLVVGDQLIDTDLHSAQIIRYDGEDEIDIGSKVWVRAMDGSFLVEGDIVIGQKSGNAVVSSIERPTFFVCQIKQTKYCRAGHAASFLYAWDADYPIIFDYTLYDHGDFWDVANPTRLTAPEVGNYLIGGNCEVITAHDGIYVELALRVQGGTRYVSQSGETGGVFTFSTKIHIGGTIIPLNTGNYVELVIKHNDTGSNATVSGYTDIGFESPNFWIAKI